MKKKGFTLVELLAVIVILAIIALITTPLILNVIENAKKGNYKIVYKCNKCGEIKRNIMAHDDNMDLVIKIMANPL